MWNLGFPTAFLSFTFLVKGRLRLMGSCPYFWLEAWLKSWKKVLGWNPLTSKMWNPLSTPVKDLQEWIFVRVIPDKDEKRKRKEREKKYEMKNGSQPGTRTPCFLHLTKETYSNVRLRWINNRRISPSTNIAYIIESCPAKFVVLF